jgi:cell wall-associated NlpC family hydrolase
VALVCSLLAALVVGSGLAVAPAASASPTTTTTTTVRGADPSSSTTTSTSPTGTPPVSAQISATEAQVAAVESQIATEQTALDQADEEYNQAVIELDVTRSSLRATALSLAADRARLRTERTDLRGDVIRAYVDDTSSTAASQLFTAPSTRNQIAGFYQQLGAGQVDAEVARVRSGSRQLDATRSTLLSEQRSETAQLAAEDQARQNASVTAARSEATLQQVQGTLATEVAEQAAAQAAAAAAAAAKAATPAAAQAAAAQASQAAQVASTVSGGSTAATDATTSANQAEGSATTAGGITVASGNSPTAAGLAAVHGAMKYLGVPYVWGGASTAGVDCSGLTMLAWAQAGVTLLHSAADQYADNPHVSLTSLEPGDLLFYDFDGSGIDHVVMYVGPELDGQPTPYGADTIIQAAHTGTVVTFDPLWTFGLVGAARP